MATAALHILPSTAVSAAAAANAAVPAQTLLLLLLVLLLRARILINGRHCCSHACRTDLPRLLPVRLNLLL